MRAATVPQEIMDLRALLASSNVSIRLDAAADLVGLPRLSAIPRPGQASGWEFQDFTKTLKPLGFVVGDRTTHGTIIHHNTFKGVMCAPHNAGQGQTTNWRASMAAMADLRRSLVDMLTVVAGMTGVLIDRILRGDLDGFSISEDPNSIRLQLAASVTQQILDNRIDAVMAREIVKPSPSDLEAVDDLRSVFRSLQKEFDLPIRKACELVGVRHGEAYAMAFGRQQVVEPTVGMAVVALQLRGLLDERRSMAKEEENEKQRKRDARTTSTPVKATKEEEFQTGMRRAKLAVLERSGNTVKELEELLHRAKVRHEQIDREVPFPSYPGVSDEMREQVAALHDEVKETERLLGLAKVEINALTAQYDNMRREKIAAESLLSDAGGDKCHGPLKQLVDVITAKMNTGDLVQAIGAIAEVKALAEKARGVL